MKYSKKILSIFLVLLATISLTQISIISSFAVVKFVSGDFEFAMVDENTTYVSAYLGEDTDIHLPSEIEGKLVTGIYTECFLESNIVSVEIPNTYKNIGNFAFRDCINITQIKMPTSLESVGTMAFYGCENLESVDFTGVSEFNKLAFAMFSGCKSLTEIHLPESVTSLNENVFVDCENLSAVTMSDSIKVIPEYAFYGCEALTNIKLPSGLTKIEVGAFENCTLLSGMELPSTLETIGESAFKNDTNLGEVFIPASVTSIGEDAFLNSGAVTCYKDTYAAEYFYNNDDSNENVLDKLIGDADLNGEVNILDVTCIQKYKIGEDTISTYRAEELADVNKDGNITIRDATLIQMYLAKIITEF